MMEPIKVDTSTFTHEQMMDYLKKRAEIRQSTIFYCAFGVVILSLFVPLGVWLTRMAMGL